MRVNIPLRSILLAVLFSTGIVIAEENVCDDPLVTGIFPLNGNLAPDPPPGCEVVYVFDGQYYYFRCPADDACTSGTTTSGANETPPPPPVTTPQ